MAGTSPAGGSSTTCRAIGATTGMPTRSSGPMRRGPTPRRPPSSSPVRTSSIASTPFGEQSVESSPPNHPVRHKAPLAWPLRGFDGLAGAGDSPERLGHLLQLLRPELINEVCPHSSHVRRRERLQNINARLGQGGLYNPRV